ncbi:hypothetical protein BBJ28_00005487 [Nothophytophthora sp. Chile5]|nr:hypothetical protein BBJ28_00005487 [Nothophytophthora sp. Chile5]
MSPTEQRSPPSGGREADGDVAVLRPLLNVSEATNKASLMPPPSSKRTRKTSKTTRSPLLDRLAHAMIMVAIAIYIWAQVMFLSPSIQVAFMNAISPVWEVPLTPLPADAPLSAYGHYEMLRPTFFVLFNLLPLLASLLLFEFVRDYNVHRHTARQLLAVSASLRRKPPRFPSIPGACWLAGFCYGELLFLGFLIGGNVVLFVYGWVNQRRFLPLPGDPYTLDTVLELSGIVFGYSCVFNMAFLFLPCTRHCAWMEIFNISYANGVKYHRWLGVLVIVTAVLHALPFYWLWGRQGVLAKNSLPCFDCQLDYGHVGYPTWFNVFGEISLLFLLALAATSIPWVRRRLFETFYYAHHLYIPAVVFAVMHDGDILWWLLPTLVLYLTSRAISHWNSLFPVQVLELTRLPEGLVKIVLARSSGGGFDVGQFVYLNVPAISKLQWHAFTISSSPRTSATSLTILAKSLGNWTEDLVEYAQLCRSKGELPVVYMDGYYGASLAGYDEHETVCLIGGGIGATPLFAILEDMTARLEASETALLPSQRVFFVLAIRELALLEEISPVLAKLKRLDPSGQRFSFRFNLTRMPSKQALDTPIDYDRLRGIRPMDCIANPEASAGLRMPPTPFVEPLRSRNVKILLYVAMLLPVTLLVLWLGFGGGVLMAYGTKTQFWPLQNFVVIAVLFVCPIVTYMVLFVERRRQSKRSNSVSNPLSVNHVASRNYSSIRPTSPPEEEEDVDTRLLTLRDLVHEYNVACGKHPDMEQIMREVHASHANRSLKASGMEKTVGVFISGPEALKTATDDAIAHLGAHDFDVHEEEFEL